MTFSTPTGPAAAAGAATKAILADLSTLSESGSGRAIVVDSPPGAGKSTLVRKAAAELAAAGEHIMIVAQTNNQVDDLLTGLARTEPHLQLGRISSDDYLNSPTGLTTFANILLGQKITDLQHCPIIIGTAAKWARVKDHYRRLAIIDEAYQMRSDALLLVAAQFDQALMVGDPGQLDPFTIVDTARWTGLSYDPTKNAVDVLIEHNPGSVVEHRLPVSWRLPSHAAPLISRAFYPYSGFIAGTRPETRHIEYTTSGFRTHLDDTLDMARRTGWALHELPARHTQRTDQQVAEAVAALAVRLLARGTVAFCEEHPNGRALTHENVAIGVVHRDQADQIRRILKRADVPGSAQITVDTANRLQGSEFEILIVVHPLSGRRDATAFHLEAGRLCVLMSRHRQACIVVTRAGITDLLDAHPATDPVHLNVPVKFPDGWEAHHTVLEHLAPHRLVAQ